MKTVFKFWQSWAVRSGELGSPILLLKRPAVLGWAPLLLILMLMIVETMNATSKPQKVDVYFPLIYVPQPDGSVLVKPGRAVALPDRITVREAAKILKLSKRRIQSLCDEGVFREGVDYWRPGKQKFFLSRESVLLRLYRPQGEGNETKI